MNNHEIRIDANGAYHLQQDGDEQTLCGNYAARKASIRADFFQWVLANLKCETCWTIANDCVEGAVT